MKKGNLKAALAAPLLFGPSMMRAQSTNELTAPRNAVVDASGARSVRVEAGAGTLRVEGKPGITKVEVHGTARASSSSLLGDIKLIAERRGDEIFIKSDMPEDNYTWSGDGDWSAALDLVVEVPQGIDADISDGSGEAEVRNVGALEASDGSGDFTIDGAKSVRITDGSGGLSILNVAGDVYVRDGSGEISARNVSGSFTVESDGSGGILATDIKGSVVVEHDGSGEINATRVGRDFIVQSKGSGEVSYEGVTGRVDIPDRRRGRYRND